MNFVYILNLCYYYYFLPNLNNFLLNITSHFWFLFQDNCQSSTFPISTIWNPFFFFFFLFFHGFPVAHTNFTNLCWYNSHFNLQKLKNLFRQYCTLGTLNYVFLLLFSKNRNCFMLKKMNSYVYDSHFMLQQPCSYDCISMCLLQIINVSLL